MNGLVYSASLMAAFLGGMLALFAPCCVVTLLPSFVAASMQRGLRSLPSTALLFSAGLAVILLPILLGIGAFGQLIGSYHTLVFITVGVFLLLLGVYILTGKRWTLPMPMMTSIASRGHNGATSTFFLGMASGVASSCCAPVMAGVVAMSALSGSWVGALGLGLSYILGMVLPLLLFAIAAHHRGERRRHTPRRVHVLGTELLWTDALSGSMFVVFGALTPVGDPVCGMEVTVRIGTPSTTWSDVERRQLLLLLCDLPTGVPSFPRGLRGPRFCDTLSGRTARRRSQRALQSSEGARYVRVMRAAKEVYAPDQSG